MKTIFRVVSWLVAIGAVGAFLVILWFVLNFGEPPVFVGAESRVVEGVVEPGETLVATIQVSVDMNDLTARFDEPKVELALVDPSPEAAVFGEFWVGSLDPTRPSIIVEEVDVQEVDFSFPCHDQERSCSIPVAVRLGNVGRTRERWAVTVSVERTTRSSGEADAFVVRSLQAYLSTEINQGQWISPGPILFDPAAGTSAFAVSIDTTVNDPSLFEVHVSEPDRWLVSRSIEAVIGPEDLDSALVYYEPSSEPLAQQATCTEDGCRIDLVALFEPRRSDWWLPLVRPSSEAAPDLFEREQAKIDVKKVEVSVLEGPLDSREASGSLSLHLEAEPGTTEAAVWILVLPDSGGFVGEQMVPGIQTDDGQNPGMYRWFELDCDSDRCRRDLTVTWDLPEIYAGRELSYTGLVVGGVGNGIVSQTPPAATVQQ